MAGGLFRATAGLCRSMIIAQTGGALALLIFFVLGGFLLPKGFFYLSNYFHSTFFLHINVAALLNITLPLTVNSIHPKMVDLGLLGFTTDVRV